LEKFLTTTGLISNEVLEQAVLNALSTMTDMQVQGLTSTVIYSTASLVGLVEIHFRLSPKEKG
jgi:hypothetical protein